MQTFQSVNAVLRQRWKISTISEMVKTHFLVATTPHGSVGELVVGRVKVAFPHTVGPGSAVVQLEEEAVMRV